MQLCLSRSISAPEVTRQACVNEAVRDYRLSNSCSLAVSQGVVSVILVMPQFLDVFPSVAPSASGSGFFKGLLTAVIELGALLGALNQGWVADAFSRRYAIVVAVAVFTLGSVLLTGATTYAMLAVARLIGGFGIGALSMVAPLYIAEISSPATRGALLVLKELSIVTGIVVAFWVSYETRAIAGEWAWRLPFLLQMVPGFVLGAEVLFLPPSPRWLASKGRDAEALAALCRLRERRSNDATVRREWVEIRSEVAFHAEVSAARHPRLQDNSFGSRLRLELLSWTDCFKPGCWRRTMVGARLMFFQQFVGINALVSAPGFLQQSRVLSDGGSRSITHRRCLKPLAWTVKCN